MQSDDYDFYDQQEDLALARLRDAEAMSEEETDSEDTRDCAPPSVATGPNPDPAARIRAIRNRQWVNGKPAYEACHVEIKS